MGLLVEMTSGRQTAERCQVDQPVYYPVAGNT